ncbi:DNA repair exonuclease [Bacillus sp. AGMB 02131]|uniref:DNA repair exonuclease n=1 Tax=Peribacillus faecalis TaxID=2772559 RepID=A0A927D0Z6_9BACI|nr:DNA repair exonuclease [Peribacillus faecalis]MBD3110247.1 DNA repair exonuclease [Peribacillus faecalis]
MKEITFIHAADLHLDSPFKGLRKLPEELYQHIKQSTFESLQKLIDEAITREVDFVLFSGDLYDGENRNLHTQVKFRKEMERLNQHGIQVFIIHGNHDHLSGKWISIEQPSNVHIFAGQSEVKEFRKEDSLTYIYGYSYPTQHVNQSIVDKYEKKPGADYHIGMLHGSAEGQSEHSRYAPFTVDELMEKSFDYWALGHIHKRQELALSPPIIYPGNIQGRHKKESGVKGCYYVKIKGKHAELDFVPTSTIVWDTLNISLEENCSFDDLLKNCRTMMEQARQESYSMLVELKFNRYTDFMKHENFRHDLLEILQEDEEYKQHFVYPYAISVQETAVQDGSHPIVGLINSYEWTEQDLFEAIQPLYKHSLGRKYITELSSDEKKQLIIEAQEMLTMLLSRGGHE